MTKTKRRTGRKRAKASQVTLPAFNGDHGTGTLAATQGTTIEALKTENGTNPNHMGRRRRVEVIDTLDLTQRQLQAAQAIRNAYCRNEMLSSGGELKEQVDSSPKPDATIAAQVDATSRLVHVMAPVLRSDRPIVEHICWHNRPGRLTGAPRWSARFKAAMDAVADRLRY
jgi:hypothetical protein